MTGNGAGPAAGTAYFPDVGRDHPGRGTPSVPLVQLAALPRRRRPGMLALALALVGTGILVAAAAYRAVDHRVPVLVVTARVYAGAVITPGDLGTAQVSAGLGVRDIPAGQFRQVVGEVAGTTLYPGTLLTAAQLATRLPPAPGQVLVPLPVRPSALPASGLAPGDQVLLVPTPGAQGQPGAGSTTVSLTAPVRGVVEAVSAGADADGYQVVDLLVRAAAGPAVAEQASTGQFAIVVTSRRP